MTLDEAMVIATVTDAVPNACDQAEASAVLGAQVKRQQREMARLRADFADAKRALPVEMAFADMQTRLREIPEDFVPITAYTDGEEIVVLGNPPDEDRDPRGEIHDCDAMGCGSLGHVVARIPYPS